VLLWHGRHWRGLECGRGGAGESVLLLCWLRLVDEACWLGLLEGWWLVAGWLGLLECCLWLWLLLLLVAGLLGLEEAGLLWLLLLRRRYLLLETGGLRLEWRREDGVDAAWEGALLLLVEAREACGLRLELWSWISKWTSARIPVHVWLLLLAAELLALWLKARLRRH
jgi:hypothetical protein